MRAGGLPLIFNYYYWFYLKESSLLTTISGPFLFCLRCLTLKRPTAWLVIFFDSFSNLSLFTLVMIFERRLSFAARFYRFYMKDESGPMLLIILATRGGWEYLLRANFGCFVLLLVSFSFGYCKVDDGLEAFGSFRTCKEGEFFNSCWVFRPFLFTFLVKFFSTWFFWPLVMTWSRSEFRICLASVSVYNSSCFDFLVGNVSYS